MSPRLASLDAILRDAADARPDDRGALSYAVARLRKHGYGTDPESLDDALTALRDERDLRDGIADPYAFLGCPPPRPCADWWQQAIDVVTERHEQAALKLARVERGAA